MSDPKKPGDMGILEHLSELRSRLIRIFTALLLFTGLGYYYVQFFFQWLSGPYHVAFPDTPLIGTGPAEAFTLKITIALFAGIIFSLPYIFYELWVFILPGLHEHEQKLALPFVIITTICFLLGILFCYHGVLPFSFAFFREEYASVGLTPQIRMSEYLSLTAKLLLAFGVIFEFPVLAFILGRLGILTSDMLTSSFRYVIAGIFIVSAVLTPPDVISQLLMVAPMIVLYGVSVLILKLVEKNPKNL